MGQKELQHIEDHYRRIELITAPIVLWRAKVATFGCTIVHPLKRWAGVQVGLAFKSGVANVERSVYYDAD